jgi:hypothetical protein
VALSEIVCAECGTHCMKPISKINRAKERGVPMCCSYTCAALHRKKYEVPAVVAKERRYPPKGLSMRERLEVSTVPEPNSGCLLWLGSVSGSGYGRIRINGVAVSTHRAAWESVNSPIPTGLVVCHKCDVRSCCNPAHLFLGTHKDNAADKVRKGRHLKRAARSEPKPQKD